MESNTVHDFHKFNAAELLVWREICRREWPKAELEVLRLIVECSFGMRRRRARIPSLNYFCEFTGQKKPHVSVALNSLKMRRVIEERPEGCYAIVALFQAWDVPELANAPALLEQLELLPEPPDLRDGLMESFLAQARPGPISAEDSRLQLRENLPGHARGASAGGQPERDEPGDGSPRGVVVGNPQAGRSDEGGDARRMVAAMKDDAPPSLPGGREKASVTHFVTTPPEIRPGAGRDGIANAAKRAPDAVLGQAVTDSVTGVTDFVTEGGFPPQTPPLGPGTRLTVNRLTVNGSARALKLGKALVTRSEENRLIELVRDFVGIEDMKKWGGMYRSKAVRNFPKDVEEAVADGRYLAQTGYVFEHRGRWLTRKIAVLAGIGSLSEISPGPPPER